MIPIEIADLMDLIYPDWPRLDDSEPDDKAAFRDVLSAARRIHDAGYTRTPQDMETLNG